MRVGIATDHGGFSLKEELLSQLRAAGHEVVDFGAHHLSEGDDYPDYVVPLAQAVVAGKVERGVAICGSGVGASVCANKVLGIRACLIHDPLSAPEGGEDELAPDLTPLSSPPASAISLCVPPGSPAPPPPGADPSRVVPRMARIVDEHGPHALRDGPHEADRGSATGGWAGAGRQGVEHEHLARGEAVALIRGQAEGCRAEAHGDQREDSQDRRTGRQPANRGHAGQGRFLPSTAFAASTTWSGSKPNRFWSSPEYRESVLPPDVTARVAVGRRPATCRPASRGVRRTRNAWR